MSKQTPITTESVEAIVDRIYKTDIPRFFDMVEELRGLIKTQADTIGRLVTSQVQNTKDITEIYKAINELKRECTTDDQLEEAFKHLYKKVNKLEDRIFKVALRQPRK